MTRLIFAHGNGFPAGTYRVLFEHWRAAGLEVLAIPRLGHQPDYPVTSGWPHLRDELLDFIAAGGDDPVHLVGHSLGGMLCLMAACRAPQRVRSLVMLDSPVVSGWRAHSVHMVKRLGLIGRVSPGKIAQKRRQHWPDRAAVHAHFAAKPTFARWDTRVLADYVACGFDDVQPGDGSAPFVTLGFSREIETRIYNTLPHHIGALLHKHPPRCPVAFVAGTQSAEMRQAGATASRRLAGERFRWIEGGHLYPMERPDDTARLVLELLETTS